MRTRNLLIICVALFAGGAVFWPTLWRYSSFGAVDRALPMRTNRITGSVELMIPGSGWVRQGDSDDAHSGSEFRELPDSDRAKITGTARFQLNHEFDASLYNGSDWNVTELEYRISTKSKNPFDDLPDGKSKNTTPGLWTRTFKSTVTLAAHTTSSNYFEVGLVADGATAEWTIVSARGRKEARK